MATEISPTTQPSGGAPVQQDVAWGISYQNLASQWSDWILDISGLHYYRARFVSYDVASTIITDSRNSVVSGSQGYYIHYEFLGVNEVVNSPYDPAIALGQPVKDANAATDVDANGVSATVPDTVQTASNTNPIMSQATSEDNPSILPTTEATLLDPAQTAQHAAIPATQVSKGKDKPAANSNIDPPKPDVIAVEETKMRQVSMMPDGHKASYLGENEAYQAPMEQIPRVPLKHDKHPIVFDKKARRLLRQNKKTKVNPSFKVQTWLKG